MSEPSSLPTLLVIDDDTEIRYSLKRVLTARGYGVAEAASGPEGIALSSRLLPPVILLDNRMEGMSGLEALQHLRSVVPDAMVILMTAYGNTQTAIEAMKFGAFDYIIKPFDPKKILALVESALAAHADLHRAESAYTPLLDSDDYKEGIVGSSEPMQEVFKIIGQVAASDVTVMITGESGTGKELIARAIFLHSLRAGRPFIAVNCAAIPDNLIESELFGHERGSFTGATNQRLGKFELCDGGTIFLDEIGDMSLPTQTKILRTLQEGEIQRVGGSSTIKVDVRLIAATNRDLETMVREKTFREDLYYRLNVVRLRLPALRERPGDIPLLVDFMLQRLVKNRKIRARAVSQDALRVLTAYRWPGNVRELENVIYRSAVMAQGESILVKDLPEEIVRLAGTTAPAPAQPPAAGPANPPESPSTLPRSPGGAPGAPSSPPPESLPPPVAPATPPPAPDALPGSPSPLSRGPGPSPGSPSLPPAPAPLPVELIGAPPPSISTLPLEAALDRAFAGLLEQSSGRLLARMEKEIIQRTLLQTGGNQVKAAHLLGITRGTLRKRIEEFDLQELT